jgi:septal ring factor EnvC (AmiA/AmiB activator)
MENKQFSVEELDQIKELQEKYNVLGIQLVQLKLSRKNTEAYLKALTEQEIMIEDQIVETNKQEKELAEALDAKYGAGSLDLESGQFTPKEV